ncbi:hypothetical protein JD844_009331 [Phrynosoma platyrhinos]|uniref:Tetratricopeptide repeat protein 39B n=1 Tax=Phrynosoma platyrhinos TaxID=52577 RepID=A0ABQ7TFK6_PHRPL|nr:hypothetical protein JD844_009331 [Phrynosoma platyrhinos]
MPHRVRIQCRLEEASDGEEELDQLLKSINESQDENMINFIKGGLKIRTSYQIYKECHQVLQMTQDSKNKNEIYHQFEGGVQLGIGAFNLMLSLLPGRILRLLEFIGFSGNRELGLQQLREGASGATLRAILCTFTLLLYHTYVSLILGTGEANLLEAETLLQPYLQKFPKGAIILFYDARIDILKGNFEKAQVTFQECIKAQQEWKQIHHLCYWELMWCYSFQQNWLQAYQYADLLCKESRWSKKALQLHVPVTATVWVPPQSPPQKRSSTMELSRHEDTLCLISSRSSHEPTSAKCWLKSNC